MKKILSIVILASFFAACGGGQAEDKQTKLAELIKQQAALSDEIRALKADISKDNPEKSSARLVATTPVTIVPFMHFVEVQAKVDGDESVNVSARSQGIVNAILVKEGDRVTKGQVLAKLDDQILAQSLAEVETQYNFAKNVYDKQKNLWDQKIGSEIQYLTAKNNKESLEKRMAAMQEQLDLTRIKAPVTGTVDNVNIKIGQAVAPGMPVFSVVNLSNLKVKGEVGESYAGKISRGDDVVLFFPDLNKEIKTKVGFSSRMINSLNRTFNVEVPVSSNETGLSPNMVVVMKIVDYKNPKAMVVPVDLLQRSGEGSYLMAAVNENGKLVARRKMVEIGKTYNGHAEVLNGITDQDVIITTGYRDLNDGEEVRTK